MIREKPLKIEFGDEEELTMIFNIFRPKLYDIKYGKTKKVLLWGVKARGGKNDA